MFLETFLGSSCKISVLRILALNPEKSFTVTELAKRAGCSPSTVYAQITEMKGVVVYNPAARTIGINLLSPYFKVLENLFNTERKTMVLKDIFSVLSSFGQYYLTGETAIIVRGLTRDLTMEPNMLHLIGDRGIVKVRGPLSAYSPVKVIIEEEKIFPEDYDEIEVSFRGWSGQAPVATVEKAIIDVLRRVDLVDKLDDVVELLLSPIVEIKDVLKIAKERYSAKNTLNILNAILTTAGVVEGKGKVKLPRKVLLMIEEAVQHVLGS